MSLYGKNPPNDRERANQLLPALERNEEKKIKDYNFKNPDKFSKEHLRVLGSIHESFCRQVTMALNSTLRMQIDFSVANVQQLTYGDFVESMPEDLLIGILNMYPLVTQFCVGIERHLVGAMMDRLLGGAGISTMSHDELTDVEVGIIKDTLKRILYYLPEAWQSLISATDDVELLSLETSPSTAQVTSMSDIVALITINVEIGSDLGLMTLCIPYSALEDVIITLSRQTNYQNDKAATRSSTEHMITKLSKSPMPLRIVLARGKLNLEDVMNLSEGDIVKLNTNLNEKSEVWIANELKFFGRPGQIDKNFAIAISEDFAED